MRLEEAAPVRRVIEAHHFLADLTLRRVVYDCNKEADDLAAAAK
jgi:acetoacetate decarboxylase